MYSTAGRLDIQIEIIFETHSHSCVMRKLRIVVDQPACRHGGDM